MLHTNNKASTAGLHSHHSAILEATPLQQPSSHSLPYINATDRLTTTSDTPRQKLEDLSRNGSEADSLLDLYRQHKIGLNGAPSSISNEAMPPWSSSNEDEADQEKWIHRDKLAVIESQEARAAGIKIPREFDVNSEVMDYDHDSYTNMAEDNGSDLRGASGIKYNALRSSSPIVVEHDQEEGFFHNLRRSSEFVGEPYEEPSSPRVYSSPGVRSSSSRIPIATSSPLPISQEHLERITPLARKRGASGKWDEDGPVYGKLRSRSHSVGSQVLLDGGELVDSTPTSTFYAQSPNSPMRLSTPSKYQAVSSGRKTSSAPHAVSTTQKVRSASATTRGSPLQRPATRSGPEGRPTTAVNRPEGDAPWLADMYKPDPRLPQDQQIIPTHAKRLQQEQWERFGKSGVGSHGAIELKDANRSSQPPPDQPADDFNHEHHDDNTAWPLQLSQSEASKVTRSPGRGSEHAGYSTIPKLSSAAPVGTMQNPRLPQPIEVQQPDKDLQKNESGCGCCIMM